MMNRTTDEITYIFREFNRINAADAVTECIKFAMKNSVGLDNPKVAEVAYREWSHDDWYGDEEDKPVPAITVKVVGS